MHTPFSHLTASAAVVRSAFDMHTGWRVWWRLILALHGKPAPRSVPVSEALRILSGGYRFYASLYRAVAAALLLAGSAVLLAPELPAPRDFTGGALLLLSLYLFAVSGLGSRAARQLGLGTRASVPALLTFMILVLVFLAIAVTGAGIALQIVADMSAVANFAVCTALFAFGLGSYLLEILYLAFEAPRLFVTAAEGTIR